MYLPTKLFTPAIQRHQLGLSLSILMTIFVYLVTLGLTIQAVLMTIPDNWREQLRTQISIEIPTAGESPALITAQMTRISERLNVMSDVRSVRAISPEEANALLQPLLGIEQSVSNLPLPLLLDVQLKPHSSLNAVKLTEMLSDIAPAIKVTDQNEKSKSIEIWTQKLGLAAAAIVIATLLALVLAVSLISRLVIAMQAQIIDLLQLMGATDSNIADQFVALIQRLSLPSALLGFTLAACTFALLGLLSNLPVSPLLMSPANLALMVLSLLLAPLLALTTAQFTSKAAIVAKLRLMP